MWTSVGTAAQRNKDYVARSRPIIRVERGRSAPQIIIHGISSGGWRGDVTAQTLLAGGLPSHLAAYTQLVRADQMLERTHQCRMALGVA